MDPYGWIQLMLFLSLLAAVTKPMGLYLVRVLDPQGKTPLDPLMRPVEFCLYRVCLIDPRKEQSWKRYALSLCVFSLAGCLLTFLILRVQEYLPMNPQGFKNVSPDLAFNIAVSFATNTNWQSYSGESTLSYFSQIVALTLHNFTSAAVGIAVAAVIVRGLARSAVTTVGNFWVDVVRITLYLLVPISFVYALFLVSQGVVQTFLPYVTVFPVESAFGPDSAARQAIALGPVASQEAIKLLGTNGGGFFNGNSAHPFENPTPLSNFVEMLSIFLIPSGMTFYLGYMVKDRRHGWTVWACMVLVFLVGVLICWWAESSGNPRIASLGIGAADGNMEGKEVRFGIFNSALFATITTCASCGAVNAMHDSFTPLGGLVPLVNIQLGEVIFGGVGSGLYGILVFIILAVFLAGLMVGRTPEYLGKKIESYDVKLAALFVLVPIFSILGFTAWACSSAWGTGGLHNHGPHGLSEILYAFSSTTCNNGSAYAGLSCDSIAYNTTLGTAMLVGRFLTILPVLALAGNLAYKKQAPIGKGSFPTSGATFGILLVVVVIIVGALTFLPALALGPVVEHFIMTTSGITY